MVHSNGYVMVKVSHGQSSQGNGNYRPKHRVVMEQAIGRPLKRHEHVHHVDGDKTNNQLDNLLLLTNYQHNKLNHFLALLNELPDEARQKIALTVKSRFPDLFS